MNVTSTVEPVQQIQQQSTVSTTTAINGQRTKTTNTGLLTTASPNNSITTSLTIDLNKLSTPTAVTAPHGAVTASGFVPSGDKEDSILDAELLALAAQKTRSPTTSLSQTPTQQLKPELKTNPAKWSVSLAFIYYIAEVNLMYSNFFSIQVTEVADFVRSLTGCADYAEDFAMQEIDGQALMLLKADHLMSAMSMKLGPALKICAKIDAMRGASNTEGGGNNNQTNGN